MKRVIFIIAGIVVFLLILYFTVNQLTGNEAKSSISSFTAEELLNVYVGNEKRANQQYLNKIIQVRGKVFTIGLLKDNQVEIRLTGIGYRSILCTLKAEKLFGLIDSIKMDEEISIEGNCIGFLDDVYLKNCKVYYSTKKNEMPHGCATLSVSENPDASHDANKNNSHLR